MGLPTPFIRTADAEDELVKALEVLTLESTQLAYASAFATLPARRAKEEDFVDIAQADEAFDDADATSNIDETPWPQIGQQE